MKNNQLPMASSIAVASALAMAPIQAEAAPTYLEASFVSVECKSTVLNILDGCADAVAQAYSADGTTTWNLPANWTSGTLGDMNATQTLNVIGDDSTVYKLLFQDDAVPNNSDYMFNPQNGSNDMYSA